MKTFFLIVAFGFISFESYTQTNFNYSTYQKGYYKPSTGTYVLPHYKTIANGTNLDNYSTKSNTNPYTNEQGYKAKDFSLDANNYGKGKDIYTGPKGGQYYYNSNGNKTYVPKRRN